MAALAATEAKAEAAAASVERSAPDTVIFEEATTTMWLPPPLLRIFGRESATPRSGRPTTTALRMPQAVPIGLGPRLPVAPTLGPQSAAPEAELPSTPVPAEALA